MAYHKNITEFEPNTDGSGLRIGVVVSRSNSEVGDGLMHSCLPELAKLGVRDSDVLVVSVPGALEIPLALQKLAQSGRFDALIAAGAVIRGETYHFEIVSNESASGVTSVQLGTGVPVANAILTANTDEQAAARMSVKGAEAARVAVEMANLVKRIEVAYK
jgi:6,7-dimethyl-8-ribityllumazine synthase